MSTRRRDNFSHFFDYTSAHGFADIKRTRHSTLWRVIWFVAIVVAWTFCGIQIVQTVKEYLLRETVTSVRVQTSNDVDFPAVTVCNRNPLRLAQLEKYYPKFVEMMAEYDSMLKDPDMGTGDLPDHPSRRKRQATADDGWDAEEDKGPQNDVTQGVTDEFWRYVYDHRINYTRIGHELHSMLLECVYQRQGCSPANFTNWVDTTYGNCYTFTPAVQDSSTFIGPAFGLSLVLYADEPHNYLPSITQDVGFQVQVHPATYHSFPEDLGFTVSPGEQVSVTVKLTKVERMPMPYDDTECSTEYPGSDVGPPNNLYNKRLEPLVKRGIISTINYTSQACTHDCFAQLIKDECECMDVSLVTHVDNDNYFGGRNMLPACNRFDQQQLECVENQTRFVAEGGCDFNCSQPCHEVNYQIKTTAAVWPRMSYFELKQNRWNKMNGAINNLNTLAEVRESICSLQVYFEQLNFEFIKESEAMSFPNMMSTVGGLMGLYGGLSFLSALQFIELFVYLIGCCRPSVEDAMKVKGANVFSES